MSWIAGWQTAGRIGWPGGLEGWGSTASRLPAPCLAAAALAARLLAIQPLGTATCAARASTAPVLAGRLLARRSMAVAVLAAVLLVVVEGCAPGGPPRAAVKGRVTLDGQPLAAGAIYFVPVGQTKGPLAAARIVDGEYSLSRVEGPVVGRVRVEIYSPMESPIPLDDPLAFAAADVSEEPEDRLSARYNRASNQFVDVKSEDENNFDFHLMSNP